MKHKHYDLIVAKAANMSLVKFIKMDGEWENAGLSDKFISFSEEYDYFLCLPQHKEACLHWLGGGDVQISVLGSDYADMTPVEGYGWSDNHVLMDEEGCYEFRIKPKKEKRWIVWDTAQSIPERESYTSLERAREHFDYPDAQFIEIEVEV